MEWSLKIREVDSEMVFEMFGLYMRIYYVSNNRIQYKGSEEQLISMGFTKIGESKRISIIMTVSDVTVPFYKGKIALPNGELVDIALCVDEEEDSSILYFPYFLFNRIVVDIDSENAFLSADMNKLKAGIEHSNRLHLDELRQITI